MKRVLFVVCGTPLFGTHAHSRHKNTHTARDPWKTLNSVKRVKSEKSPVFGVRNSCSSFPPPLDIHRCQRCAVAPSVHLSHRFALNKPSASSSSSLGLLPLLSPTPRYEGKYLNQADIITLITKHKITETARCCPHKDARRSPSLLVV